MKKIVIAAQKGGAGKTTLARNLSVAAAGNGQDILCIDLDPQKSLRHWWDVRDDDTPAMLDRDPAPDMLETALNAAGHQFDLCFLDTPPAAGTWLVDTIRCADLVLLPVRPSPDDLRAIGSTLTAVTNAKVSFAFVMMQTPRARITEVAARELARHGRVAPVNIYQRIIYAETGTTGKGVTEAQNPKAVAEITLLWDYVKELINDEKSTCKPG